MNARVSGSSLAISPAEPAPVSLSRSVLDSSVFLTSGKSSESANSSRRSSKPWSVYSVPFRNWLRILNSFKRCSSLMPTATGTGTIPPRIAAQNAIRKRSFDLVKTTISSPGCMPRCCMLPSNKSALSRRSAKAILLSSFSPSMSRTWRSLPRPSSRISASVS